MSGSWRAAAAPRGVLSDSALEPIKNSSPQRPPLSAETYEAACRDRFILFIKSLVGERVEIQARDRGIQEGIFHTCTPFEDMLYQIVLRMSAAGGTEPTSTVYLKGSDIIQLHAPRMPISAGADRHQFAADKEIGGRSGAGGRIRDLEAVDSSWVSGPLPSESTGYNRGDARGTSAFKGKGLGEKDGGSASRWDQFEANERLFNVKSSYDENLYTSRLDKSKMTPEMERKAEMLAREIEGNFSSNIHLREERNQQTEQDGEVDEEERYSSVRSEVSVKDKGNRKPYPGAAMASRSNSSTPPLDKFKGFQAGSTGTEYRPPAVRQREEARLREEARQQEEAAARAEQEKAARAEHEKTARAAQSAAAAHLKQTLQDTLSIGKPVEEKPDGVQPQKQEPLVEAIAASPTVEPVVVSTDVPRAPADAVVPTEVADDKKSLDVVPPPSASIPVAAPAPAQSKQDVRVEVAAEKPAAEQSKPGSKLNPNAKEFKFNPKAKAFTPSAAPAVAPAALTPVSSPVAAPQQVMIMQQQQQGQNVVNQMSYMQLAPMQPLPDGSMMGMPHHMMPGGMQPYPMAQQQMYGMPRHNMMGQAQQLMYAGGAMRTTMMPHQMASVGYQAQTPMMQPQPQGPPQAVYGYNTQGQPTMMRNNQGYEYMQQQPQQQQQQQPHQQIHHSPTHPGRGGPPLSTPQGGSASSVPRLKVTNNNRRF